jgi:hypothetical protein
MERALAAFNEKMVAEDLLQQQRLRRMEINLQYREKMLPEYTKRLEELNEKSRNRKVFSLEEARATGDELKSLNDTIFELKNRDVFTDWGMDYEGAGSESSPSRG